MDSIVSILFYAPPILLALTVHEYAHGWVAYKYGDPTAKYAGRLTLNPLAHLDFLGTIMLFLIHLGWAKPVPVNPYNLRNPKRDMMWVSFAGPGANLLTALICGLIIRFFGFLPLGMDYRTSLLGIFLQMVAVGLVINVVLAIFNLIPIPPLDGSKILMGLLPPQYEQQFAQLERFGPFLLIFLVLVPSMMGINILWMVIQPFVSFFSFLFAGIDLSRFF
jgi:Zn-dependent protease